MGKNFGKLVVFLLILGGLLWALNTFVIDISTITGFIFENFNTYLILLSLFLSEIGTGLLPPDLYILWAKEFSQPYLMVLLLAAISYTGGVLSYLIGTRLYAIPKVKIWVEVKFGDQFMQLRKFGGLLIFLASMTPLPFPPVCVLAGIMKFPFNTFLAVASARFLRFFVYAAIIFLLM